MNRETVRELLLQLRDILREEREHAKALDLTAMLEAIRRKESLIKALGAVDHLHPDDQPYAREIQQENRRNAYLYRATLNWIQETMEFFGKKTVPITYSHYGHSQNSTINGRLLSGKI